MSEWKQITPSLWKRIDGVIAEAKTAVRPWQVYHSGRAGRVQFLEKRNGSPLTYRSAAAAMAAADKAWPSTSTPN